MSIATMFCCGRDADAPGVDGIRGCTGVFVALGGWEYRRLDPDGLVAASRGHLDAADHDRRPARG